MTGAEAAARPPQFWLRLQVLRRNAGKSWNGISQEARISRPGIEKWRRGQSRPVLANLKKLAPVLGVHLDVLIRLLDDPTHELDAFVIWPDPESRAPRTKLAAVQSPEASKGRIDSAAESHVEPDDGRAAWRAAVDRAAARRTGRGELTPDLRELAYAASFGDGLVGGQLEEEAERVVDGLLATPTPGSRARPLGVMKGGTPLTVPRGKR